MLGDGLGTKLVQKGDWTIFRSEDPMTDIARCVAIYKGDNTIQLDHESLAFDLQHKGGVRGYRVRWDNLTASDWIPASSTEEGISAVLLTEDKFAPLTVGAKRVRVEVETVLNSNVEYDIALSAAPAALEVLGSPLCLQKSSAPN